MAILRCADITLQNGFKFFAISSGDGDTSTFIYQTPQTSSGSTMSMPFGTGVYSRQSGTTHGGFYIPITKPRVICVIKCFVEKPDGIDVFDAEFVKKSICSKYGLR